MNKSTLEYKAYLGLLEGKIDENEHKRLLKEIGFLSKLGTSLKSLAKAGGTIFGNVKRIYNDENFKALSAKIGKQIEASTQEIKDLGQKLEIPEDQVNFMIAKLIAAAAGIKPQTLTQVATNKPPAQKKDEGGEGSSAEPGSIPVAEPASGTKVSTDNISALAGVLADLSGQQREKTVADANKNKADAVKFIDVTSKLVSRATKVKPEVVKKIITVLIDKGHIVKEGKNLYRSSSFGGELVLEGQVVERWQHLAGLINEATFVSGEESLLNEDFAGDLALQIASGKISTAEELRKKVNSIRGKLSLSQSQIATLTDLLPEEGEAPADKQELQSQIQQVVGKGDSQQPPAQKRFASAFKDIKQQLGDDATDDDINAVLDHISDALDDYKIA